MNATRVKKPAKSTEPEIVLPDPDIVGIAECINSLIHKVVVEKKTDDLSLAKLAGQLMIHIAGIGERHGDVINKLEVADGVLDRLTGPARIFVLFAAMEAVKKEIE